MTVGLIGRSFELASERCDDLTPLVYQRLFREHPELEQFFIMDKTGAARGSMLSWVISALLDYCGDRSFGQNLIQAEAVNHTGMGVEPEQFRLFFNAIASTVHDVIGPDWTPEMSAAWATLLGEIEQSVTHPS